MFSRLTCSWNEDPESNFRGADVFQLSKCCFDVNDAKETRDEKSREATYGSTALSEM
jgi:hypothetical protein